MGVILIVVLVVSAVAGLAFYMGGKLLSGVGYLAFSYWKYGAFNIALQKKFKLKIFFSVIRTDLEKEMLIFDGSLRITYGDQYQSNLKNTSSKAFHEKATKYSAMVNSGFQNEEG